MDQITAKYVATAAVALAVATLVLTGFQSADARPKGPKVGLVEIVNPLPLPVTGSSVVSGQVAATQSGPWEVAVSGTVSVKNVDERGRNPFRVRVHCENSTGNGCFVDTPAVPMRSMKQC